MNGKKDMVRSYVLLRTHSLAFPSISTGVYGYPKEKAAMIAVRTVSEFTKENPGTLDIVEWALFDNHTLQIYESALK